MDKEVLKAIITKKSFYIDYKGKDESLIKELKNFKNNKYLFLYNISFNNEQDYFNVTLNFLIKIAKYMINLIIMNPVLEMNRESISISLQEEDYDNLKNMMPFMLNEEFIDNGYLDLLFDNIINIFKEEICNYKGSVASYFKKKDNNLNVASRIYFHLVENKKSDEYPFAFLATYAKQDVENNNVLHTPLEKALIEFENDNNKLIYLLSAVTKASENSKLIKNLIESGDLFSPTYFTVNEAYTFFKEVKFYESLGIMCRIPKWQKTNSNKATVKLDIKKKSSLNISSILNLVPEVYIDDEVISEEELNMILKSDCYLIKYKNKWINTSEKELEKILNALKVLNKSKSKDLTLFELLKLEFNPNKELNIENDIRIELSYNEWYENFKKELSNPSIITDVAVPKNLKANLRKYQQVGYNWLSKMLEYGLGACLADDMGLGKTLQVITLLTKLYEKNNLKTLLVVPASLMINWKKEFAKFSDVEPIILHNSAGVKIENIKIENKVYITSYKLASRFIDEQFDLLILDEAQAIKNVGTTQTQNIKKIKSSYKIALTGTPIENNLGDLYSLFDFLNNGLLGNQRDFVKKANKYIEDDNFNELRNLVKPFILRRLKSDKSIISDLPEKLENNKYIELNKVQVELYKKEVDNIEKILSSEEEVPKGLILNSIMKFKQICNHPSQFLNDGEYNFDYSAKYDALKIIAENVLENQERMLVFTQFKEMTEPISNFLESIFKQKGMIIHGSTSVKKRDEIVTEFNSDKYIPYIVLSLKAGGTGLNLVSANHVVHFDRWWNPAVENQATDRAFRIGQNKNVFVHKFVCIDTIEEKIDEILKSKQSLSDNILKSNDEGWISKLNKKEILNLFRYGGK